MRARLYIPLLVVVQFSSSLWRDVTHRNACSVSSRCQCVTLHKPVPLCAGPSAGYRNPCSLQASDEQVLKPQGLSGSNLGNISVILSFSSGFCKNKIIYSSSSLAIHDRLSAVVSSYGRCVCNFSDKWFCISILNKMKKTLWKRSFVS